MRGGGRGVLAGCGALSIGTRSAHFEALKTVLAHPGNAYINRCDENLRNFGNFFAAYLFSLCFAHFLLFILCLCVLFVLQFSSIILMQQICRRISCSKEFFQFRLNVSFFYDFYFCQFTTHAHPHTRVRQTVSLCKWGSKSEGAGCGCKLLATSLTCHKKSIKYCRNKNKQSKAGITKGARDAHQFVLV